MYTWNKEEYAEGSGAKLDSPDPRIQPGAEVLVGRAWDHGWNPNGLMDHYLGTRQTVCGLETRYMDLVSFAGACSSWNTHWKFERRELVVLRTFDGEPTEEEEWLSFVRAEDRWEAPFGSITRWAIRAGILVPDGGNGYKPDPARLALALGEPTKAEEKPAEVKERPHAPTSPTDARSAHARCQAMFAPFDLLREAAKLMGDEGRLHEILLARARVLLAGTMNPDERRGLESVLAGTESYATCSYPFDVTPKVIAAAEEQLALLTGRRGEHEDQSGESYLRSFDRWLTGPCRSGK